MDQQNSIKKRLTTFVIGKNGKPKRKRNKIQYLDVCGKACQTTR
ncbi:hypothetical protein [Dendrosporobacter sp. 1207_IL3150]